MSETIAAIATAHGIGGICIVRISGGDALRIALAISHRSHLEPRRATLADLFDASGEIFGEAILIYFKSPHSFTGEDVVEIQTHGGFVVSSLALEAAVSLGARIAHPGEFSKRAFLNNKMDLSKAEAISDLINSRSQSAAKILARNLRGELEGFIGDLRAALVKTLAFVEVCIDYAEEDLPSDVLQSSQKMLDENIKSLEKITRISRSRKGLIEGFKVAIVGRPNVGKSSILNALLNFERAIVSDEAGTTRDLIEESLKIGTHLIRIIDTAGIRQSSSTLENIGISYSVRAASEADVILAIFDASREFSEEDGEILKILRERKDKKIIYVFNKCDLPRKFKADANSLGENLAAADADSFKNLAQSSTCENSAGLNFKSTADKNLEAAAENFKISAGDSIAAPLEISVKEGVDKILTALESYLDSQNFDGLMLSNDRQIGVCETALEALQSAREKLKNEELEIFAFEINRAIAAIAQVSRPFERDEILDEMFGNFCLGK